MTYTERINAYKALDINQRINFKSWSVWDRDNFTIERAIVGATSDYGDKFLTQPLFSDWARVLIYKFPWLNIKRSARRECPPSVHRRMAREFKREFGKDIDAEDDI